MSQTLKPKEIIMTSLKLASASLVALVALSAGSAFALDRTAAQRQADGDAFRASRIADLTPSTPNLGDSQPRSQLADPGQRVSMGSIHCRNDHTAGQCIFGEGSGNG